jgi:hypothetical protein
MWCAFHPEKIADAQCPVCGRGCCAACLPAGTDPPLCPECRARLAVPVAETPAVAPPPTPMASSAPTIVEPITETPPVAPPPTPAIPTVVEPGTPPPLKMPLPYMQDDETPLPLPPPPIPVLPPMNRQLYDGPTLKCKEATEALTLAILGILCGLGIFFAPFALAKAMTAKRLIAEDPTLEGDSTATAAMVIAIISLVFSVLVFVWLMFGASSS